jgi:hypothetical protein
MLTRRQCLLAPALMACRRRRPSAFPGYALVAGPESRAISVVDLRTFSLARQIRLPAPPGPLLAHPTRPVAWALAPDSGLLCELDLDQLRPARQLAVARSAVSMRLAGDTLWVLCRDPSQLVAVSLEHFRRLARISLTPDPLDFDLAPYVPWAAVSHASTGTVSFVDLEARRSLPPVDFGRRAATVRFRSDGRLLLVANADQPALTILEVPTAALVVHLPLAIHPRHFCFKADGGQLFLTGPGADVVVIVYPYRTEVAETILAGRAPAAMAVSTNPEYLLVASPQNGDVNIVEIETRHLVAAANVGEGVGALAVTPDNQFALALNQRAGALAVIRIPTTVRRRLRLAPLFTVVPVGPRPASLAIAQL